ncbi:hypothetical protein [Paraburkholderia phenoliruptrix]|uniref:hypothetical protein n=1 Tax=Paraburkholderia phenoliruptrix TaxID=252970 RepID=UPI0039B57A87
MFILAKAGESAPVTPAVPAAVSVVTSEKKLQKMDFWIRNPDHFAYALIEAYIENGDADLLASAKAIVDSEEPEIRRDAMLKYFYGAYEPLDTALAPLFSYGLACMRRNPETKQRMYFLLPKGLDVTKRLETELPEAQWYSERAMLIGTFSQGKSGDQLAKWQYRHPTYAGARNGETIACIAEEVRERIVKLEAACE